MRKSETWHHWTRFMVVVAVLLVPLLVADLLTVLVIALLFSLTMLVRNELVFDCRMRALAWAHEQEDYWEAKKIVDRASYNDMWWDFSKWTFGHFFPDLRGKV